MVKKVSLLKIISKGYLKNFEGGNANLAHKRSKKVKSISKKLKKKGYTGKKLVTAHKKVKTQSREDKMREAVAKHIIKKRKR